MNNIGTVTLRQPRLLYTSSITTRSSGTTTGSGTTNRDDGLQSTGTLAGTGTKALIIQLRAHKVMSAYRARVRTPVTFPSWRHRRDARQ